MPDSLASKPRAYNQGEEEKAQKGAGKGGKRLNIPPKRPGPRAHRLYPEKGETHKSFGVE